MTELKKEYCEHYECKRRLKFSDYPCKCGKIFCKFHRIPEDHNCCYDYKENLNKKQKIEDMKCIKSKVEKL